MVRLTIKRNVIKKEKKKASTYADKLHHLSAGQLIEILATAPDTIITPDGETKKSPLKILARNYLKIIHGMTNDQIDERVKVKKSRYQRIGDLGKYYRGEKSPEEISEKWAGNGYTPELVHSNTKHVFRFSVPAGQKPIIASNPVVHKFHQLKQQVIEGKIPYKVLEDFLLDLAYERPEFAANVAHMLFTDDEDNYIFHGKKGEDLRNKFEDIITERNIAFNRRNPGWQEKNVLPFSAKSEIIKEYNEGKVNGKMTTHGYDNVMFKKSMYERKKKQSTAIKRKKPSRVIKAKTPVKKCRCK